jgi:uridine phosphorylase
MAVSGPFFRGGSVEKEIIPDEERPIIRPHGGGTPLEGSAVMAATSWDLKVMTRITGAYMIPGGTAGLYNVYKAGDEWGGIAIAGPFFGAPHAVVGLEQMIARGARRIWVVGWCGSLSADARVGELVVPTGAVSEEGTSAHYPIGGKDVCPDPQMLQELRFVTAKRGLKTTFGTVWTTDAIYRETAAKVKRYARMGVSAVEMEMSALFTVAIFRGIALAGILVVSDELFDLKWRHGFGGEALKQGSEDACLLALELASGRIKESAL